MAHVEQKHLPHSLVAMPPHAWSTQHQLSTSLSNTPTTTSFPSSSPQSFNPSWNSAQHSHPPLSSDPLHQTDQTDHLNADTIFRDLLNLRIDTDQPPSSHLSLQSHLPVHTNPLSTQLTPHPSILHQDHFSHTDQDSNHLDPTHQTNHHHSLDHFSSHSSAVPFFQTRINPNQPHDPSLTDSMPISLLPPYTSLTPFTSSPSPNRPESSQTPVFRTSIPPHHSRPVNPSRSNPSLTSSHTGPRIKNDLYKTEICRSFAENSGFCKYGSKCQFAHGEEELRPVRRHPRYKTKLCRNFVNNGSCPYDTRCRFIHANDLPYVSAPTLSALHHSPLPAPSASESADPSRYETPDLIGDHYANNLRHILSLTPAAPAAQDLSAPDPSLPVPSRFSSSVPDVETSHSSVKDSLKKQPAHHILAEHHAAQSNPAIPDDHIYQANASPFSKYPDGAQSQSYGPVDPDNSIVTSSKTRDQSAELAAETADMKKVRQSRLDFRTHEIFTTELQATQRSTTNRNNGTSMQETANSANEGANLEWELKVTPSKATRARLPVFRNMTSGGDSV